METAARDMSEVITSTAGAGESQRFISCCQEELVEVEIEAFQQGNEQAVADGSAALREMVRVSAAAARACDHALAVHYFALDEAKFRDVFILAWCAGYRTQTRTPQPAVRRHSQTDK